MTAIELAVADLPCGPLPADHDIGGALPGWDDPFARKNLPGGKHRVTVGGEPAIEWAEGTNLHRALMTGRTTWRECALECRVQALQAEDGPAWDGDFYRHANAGLVFRAETSRRHYFFCIEGKRRLVLYRRMDDEWHALAAQEVECGDRVLTLRVDLIGDGIDARCPEQGVAFAVTDGLLKSGRMGFRASGRCRLFGLTISVTPSQQCENRRLAEQLIARTAHLGAGVPDATKVGQVTFPADERLMDCTDFVRKGANDFLFATPDGLVARDWAGAELWRVPGNARYAKIETRPEGHGPRRIYALMGERASDHPDLPHWAQHDAALAEEVAVVDGATGSVLARAPMPRDPNVDKVLRYDFARETGRLTGDAPTDVIVRSWRRDQENGGSDLWAFDADLAPLWTAEVDPPYGHHDAVRLFDFNRDGHDEILAGGLLLGPDGKRLAQLDRVAEVRSIHGATHYDAVWCGDLSGDPDLDPLAFLLAGSGGVYVVDPLTGRTYANHRIGHAQWGQDCKVRPDLPGREVMVGTRWGNYGILTLFSGRGERLWSIHPDYHLEGSCPVQWLPDGPEHIWVNTSVEGMGLYDGHGRLVKPLTLLRKFWRAHASRVRRVYGFVARRAPGEPDLLCLPVNDTLHVFGRA